jgi:protein-S-isoprenylcysteine O-methyltransferase Ste14
MMTLRHLLSVLILPFMVVVALPTWLLSSAADTRWPPDWSLRWLPQLAGLIIAAAGLALFIWCVSLFAQVGHGTLAPWDPTQNLVAAGPYRFVRNPMISAVALLLIGQALFFGSRLVGGWAALFLLINHVYFIVSEEPGLEQRFGENYRRYKASVPRWFPRLRP